MLSAEEGLMPALIEIYQMEKGIWLFYQQLAWKSENEKARSLFAELAEWENGHMRFIEYLYQGLQSDTGVVSFEAFSKAPPEYAEGGSPLRELEGRMDEFAYRDDAEAVEFAMSIEAKEYELYKSLSQRTHDTALKLLFENLMDWELTHIRYLRELMQEVRPKSRKS